MLVNCKDYTEMHGQQKVKIRKHKMTTISLQTIYYMPHRKW